MILSWAHTYTYIYTQLYYGIPNLKNNPYIPQESNQNDMEAEQFKTSDER